MSTPETMEKNAIKQYLNLKGIFWYYNLQTLGSYKGIPDLTFIKDGKTYQAEIKSAKGHQSEYQKDFQHNWEANGGVYILGGIDEVLKYIK